MTANTPPLYDAEGRRIPNPISQAGGRAKRPTKGFGSRHVLNKALATRKKMQKKSRRRAESA